MGLPNLKAGNQDRRNSLSSLQKSRNYRSARADYQQNQFSYESRIENKRKRPNLLHRNRLQAKSEVKKKVGRGRFAGGGFIRSKTGLSLLLGG
jgi:hypothetical protein